VRDTENHSLREASCCKVEVVNGAEGLFFQGLISKSEIEKLDDFSSSNNFCTSSGFFSAFEYSASNGLFSLFRKFQITLNAQSDSNSWISLSRSTIRRTATDWTRHADSHVLIFLHRTGDNSNHTKRSKTLLACCASTRRKSMVLGF
jgi:hypothetical protein